MGIRKKIQASWWWKHLLFIIGFHVSSWLSWQMIFSDGNVGSIWMPFGFAIAFMVRFGYQYALTGFLMEAYYGYAVFERAMVLNELTSIGNMACLFLGCWFFRKVSKNGVSLTAQRDVFALVLLTAFVSPLVSAFVGAGGLTVFEAIPREQFSRTFLVWWQADVIGIVVITPLLLSIFSRKSWRILLSNKFEFACLIVAVFSTLAIVAAAQSGYRAFDLALVYLLFPVTLWAAARFEMLVNTFIIALVSTVLVLLTISGLGPFHQSEVTESLVLLQGFTFALASTGLLVGVNSLQRREATNKLLDANQVLEERVAQRTAELENSKQRAEAANQAKSMFLATMSHEIRTPLNGVLGFTDVLRATPLTEEQRTHLDTLHESGEGLLRIINDILDFSKIESEELQIHPHCFDLRKLISETVNLYSPNAALKGIALHCEVAPELPKFVESDSNRIRQILNNLVSNAIKFTENGQVRIELTGQALTDINASALWHLTLLVSDTGLGMEQEDAERLFEPFTQIDSSMSRQYGGTGLGLAICRRICKRMGGDISLSSQLGRGSTFKIELDVKEVKDDSVSLSDAKKILSSAQRDEFDGIGPDAIEKSEPVLLVEDNRVNRRVGSLLLNQLGYGIAVVENGFEAVRAYREHQYSIILMDIQMPVMDGLEATKRIRDFERTDPESKRSAYIVALSANVQPEDRSKAEAAGVDDYLTKPLRVGDLEYALRKAHHPENSSRG
ncbi:MAG: ATP-binding protein [Verrucomicrobiota bacterium]